MITAAAITVAVFAAFVPSPDVMLLVPAVMHLLGRSNCWLSTWLDHRLPQLYVEGRPELHLPQELPAEGVGTYTSTGSDGGVAPGG